jgi:hypothetical protein
MAICQTGNCETGILIDSSGKAGKMGLDFRRLNALSIHPFVNGLSGHNAGFLTINVNVEKIKYLGKLKQKQ